jgi:hypothetical protein
MWLREDDDKKKHDGYSQTKSTRTHSIRMEVFQSVGTPLNASLHFFGPKHPIEVLSATQRQNGRISPA